MTQPLFDLPDFEFDEVFCNLPVSLQNELCEAGMNAIVEWLTPLVHKNPDPLQPGETLIMQVNLTPSIAMFYTFFHGDVRPKVFLGATSFIHAIASTMIKLAQESTNIPGRAWVRRFEQDTGFSAN